MAEELMNGAAAESTAGTESSTVNEESFSGDEFLAELLGEEPEQEENSGEGTEQKGDGSNAASTEQNAAGEKDKEGEGKAESEEPLTSFVEHGKTYAVPQKAIEDFAKGVGITPAEVIDYYQKGRNYGALQEKYNAALADGRIIEELVELSGLSREQAVGMLKQRIETFPVEAKKAELSAKYPGATPQMIEDLAKAQVLNERNSKQQKAEALAQDEAFREKQAKIKEIDDFLVNHPECKEKGVDQSVIDAFEGGIPLETAFKNWQEKEDNNAKIAELEAKLAAEKEKTKKAEQAAFNKSSTVGSIAGHGESLQMDDFIAGLQ